MNEYNLDDITIYSQTTRDIKVSAAPVFLDDESNPEENRFFWAYHLRIENNSGNSVRVLKRTFTIADALGNMVTTREGESEEERPVINSGDAYECVGETPLGAPSGLMLGKLGIINENGDVFEVEIPAFSLDSPYEKRALN